MIWNYFIDNLLAIAIAFGGAVAWVLDRKKRNAEFYTELESLRYQSKQNEAEALSGMQKVYNTFVTDVKAQLADLRDENTELKEKIFLLEKSLMESNLERSTLAEQVDKFKKQSERDSVLIGQLKVKIEKYEKELRSFRKELK